MYEMVKAFALGEREAGQSVTPDMLSDVLGVRKYSFCTAEKENKIGQVTGLADFGRRSCLPGVAAHGAKGES